MLSCRPYLAASCLLAAMVFGALAVPSARAQSTIAEWERFDFAKKNIDPARLEGMSLEDLKLLRGIVFGKHGRIFKDADIKAWLAKRPWFKPNPLFRNSMLNEVENRNLDIIREAEARQHYWVEPGDMRFYMTEELTPERLGDHSAAEWRILIAEVEAIHGKRFDDEAWLQEYFEERYWYKPSANYDPKVLSAVERKNLETMQAIRHESRRGLVSPGDMGLFQEREISEAMLHGLGLYELRLLRNEVYARRGRTFKVQWLQQYFWGQQWYEPLKNGREPVLTAVEKKNVETIAAYEERLRAELSSKPLDPKVIEGIFLEDARKLRYEIYARHGKVFGERWVRDYFKSMPWYKPDPGFKEASLTEVERANVEALRAYEAEAMSELDAIEG